jgi:hypothetical protein
MPDPSIRVVVDHILGGRIRIPAFQRGFVWDASRVAYFMDTLYKGYPFGAVLLWRTTNQLRTERTLGPFDLPAVDPSYPIDYVLDGQQRLTSIFGVFQTELPRSTEELDDRFDVYFDLSAETTVQESEFSALLPDEVEPERHFPLSVLFDVVKYREATERFDGERLQTIDRMQQRFKEVSVPVQTFESDNKASVAIVFERVNRFGIELDTLQLLSAWTWSEDFDLQEKFEELAEQLEPFGFGLVGEDTNLLLRCCAAVIRNEASPNALMQLNGEEVRDRFDEIVNGILGAIDFLRANLEVHALKNLPYATFLVPLSAFFAIEGNQSVTYDAGQRDRIMKWFWRSCMSRRYSSDVIRKLETDIAELVKLKNGESSAIDSMEFSVSTEWFYDAGFNTYGVATKVFILMLAQWQPRSFVSGNRISLEPVLKDYNRNEFHHCYPRKYLKDLGRETRDINRLANFVFMSRADNSKLGGVAPSKYRERMSTDAEAAILADALCPPELFDDDYDAFLRLRTAILIRAAWQLAVEGHPVPLDRLPEVGQTRARISGNIDEESDKAAPA